MTHFPLVWEIQGYKRRGWEFGQKAFLLRFVLFNSEINCSLDHSLEDNWKSQTLRSERFALQGQPRFWKNPWCPEENKMGSYAGSIEAPVKASAEQCGPLRRRDPGSYIVTL